jgi:DNA-binding NtrC family response regulator
MDVTTGEVTSRILIVDDDVALVRAYVRGLELAGHKVVGAADGWEVLHLLAARPFDVLISDVCMPDMTGVELAERMREVAPDVPVLLMTASLDPASYSKARDAGIVRYLRKPVPLERLALAVDQALRLRTILLRKRARLSTG